MIRHVAVIVPARDEQDLIAASIASINRARRALDRSVTSSCVIVADSCSDRTVEIARSASRSGPPVEILEVHAGNVGTARRRGTSASLARLDVESSSIWLANTDADTIVPEDWLSTQVRLATRGAEAVAGIVALSPDDTSSVLLDRFRAAYRSHPDGTHAHVHGANFGLRADVYVAAGGWAPLATGEEHDLLARLGDVRIERTIALRVQTSARHVGRAPSGFADDLAAHLVDTGASASDPEATADVA